ncbi:MAG TPA: DNA mismatch repair endonuclease MutH [Polyangiaceae bacterium]|nr:DNA mismatch repair endonuclease MutH [Polyangiaceae bacterium]
MIIPPPQSEAELRERAAFIAGKRVAELAALLHLPPPPVGVRGKGKVGGLVEKALGARAGSAAIPDFPSLGVELKTIPVDAAGHPRESTFVSSISLGDADRAEWFTSSVRAKLQHVLFVPISTEDDPRERSIGAPLFWRPTAEQEAILAQDFDEAMGLIAVGRVESLTARSGRWLQVRPKAATGRVRAVSLGGEGEWIETVPRGFYLRASFTRAILADPFAVP